MSDRQFQAAYCSRACQASAWKSHKTVCGISLQFEQALPSQAALDVHLAKRLEEVANIDLSPPPEIQLMMALSKSIAESKGKK
jgi:hypothetical protein